MGYEIKHDTVGKILKELGYSLQKNWRGKPLISVEAVINLISSTTTSKGLKIICIEDRNHYVLGTTVTPAELDAINIVREDFHGNWNYAILPNR